VSADDPGEGRVVLEFVLGRVAEELSELAWLAHEIQAVSDVVARQGGIPHAGLLRLQDLDRLTQTLGDLAKATEVAAQACRDATIETETLTKAVILHDLRDRLLGATEPTERRATGAGRVTLF